MLAQRRCRSRAGWSGQEPGQESVEALVGLCLPLVGEREGEHGRVEWGMAQGALAKSGMDASFEERGGGRMSEGRESHAQLGHASPLLGRTAGTLNAGAPQGRGRRGPWLVSPPGGGKEPGGVPRGLPGGAAESQRLGGQGDVPVCGAVATMDLALAALAINVGDLQGEGLMEPEAQTRDRGAGDLGVQRGGGREEPSDFFHTEESGETGGCLCA
jgi:hypothetical protein